MNQHPLVRLAERGQHRGADAVIVDARAPRSGHARPLIACVTIVIAVILGLTVIGQGDDTSEVRTAGQPGTPTVSDTSATTGTSIGQTGCSAPAESTPVREGLDVTVTVYVFCGTGVGESGLIPVERVVPDDGAPLRASIIQLLIGVTPDEARAGLNSAFSPYTAGMLLSVDVDGSTATIDLTAEFAQTNNFSTSNLSAVVLSQIEATVFQFPEIDGIELQVGGERFCGWETSCDGAPEPLMSRPG